MDDSVIEFASEANAQEYADDLYNEAIVHAQVRGYTISSNEIVGKNALTGLDDPSAQHTTSWAQVNPSGESFTVTDETGTPIFSGVVPDVG